MAVDPDLACKIFINIGQLWMKEKFSDLTISVGDYQFNCHKFHLCAVSEFFNILLGNDGTDGSENTLRHLKISGISPEIFGLVLKAVYKGEICVEENNMIQVWHATHELQIDVLVSKCEDFVIAHMTLKNYENIYQSSVLLESARVRDFVLEFMAKHFVKISQKCFFLALPSKFLVSIVSSKAFVVESRECLVDLILMWANHKSENGDEESDDNTVVVNRNDSKRETQCETSDTGDEKPTTASSNLVEETKGDKQCVEIMFSEPPAGLEDESSRQKMRQILQVTERREETLGKLLDLAKLEQTSPEYLKSLVKNDWLMGIKEARNIVWTTIVSKISAKASPKVNVEVSSATPTKTETFCDDVYLYRLKNSSTILAHRWTTGKRHVITRNFERYFSYIEPTFYGILPTFLEPQHSDETQRQIKLEIGKEEIAPGDILHGSSHPVVVGSFLYCFKGNEIYRTPQLTDSVRSWFCIGSKNIMDDADILHTVIVNKDLIMLFYGPYKGSEIYLKLFIFNTSDNTIKLAGKICLEYEAGNIIIFFHDNQPHILLENGSLLKVQLKKEVLQVDLVGLRCAKRDKVRLFPTLSRLYGVVSQGDELIIFADLPIQTVLPRYSRGFQLYLEFVQIVTEDNRGYRVRIPESWLGREV